MALYTRGIDGQRTSRQLLTGVPPGVACVVVSRATVMSLLHGPVLRGSKPNLRNPAQFMPTVVVVTTRPPLDTNSKLSN